MRVKLLEVEALLIPRFSGIAYMDATSATAVILPVPFNVLAGLIHRAWVRLKIGLRPDVLIMVHTRAYNEGRQAGYDQTRGEVEAVKQATAELLLRLHGTRDESEAAGDPASSARADS